MNETAAPGGAERSPKGVLSVALAEPGDLDDLVRLMQARDAHYAAWTPPPSLDAAAIAGRISGALFGDRPIGEALVARRAGRAVGVAYFGSLFPGAGLAPAIFLKDMFVLEAARGAGVGRALLARLRRIARGRGADRVELHVHPDNARAREFYAREGLKEADRVVIRVDF